MRQRVNLGTTVDLTPTAAWGAALTIFGPVLSGILYFRMIGAAVAREDGTIWGWLLLATAFASLLGPILILLGLRLITSGEIEDIQPRP
jgi:hypothetical protein